MSNYKIHPHNECGICSKPRGYKEQTRLREAFEAELEDLLSEDLSPELIPALERWVHRLLQSVDPAEDLSVRLAARRLLQHHHDTGRDLPVLRLISELLDDAHHP